MAPRILRRFLYLDPELTDEYLAQAEGGLYDEEEQNRSSASGKEGEGGLAVGPLHVGGGGSKTEEEGLAKRVRQVAESSFTRLDALLRADDDVQWLETVDDEVWDQLERGEVLEIECQLKVPQFVHFAQTAFAMGPMSEVMAMAGQDLEINEEASRGLKALQGFAAMMDGIPVIASAAGSPDFKFAAHLNAEALRVPVDRLDGEVRLYATLERKLKDDEKYSLIDSFPVFRNPVFREAMGSNLEEVAELQDMNLTKPAAVVSPIAIFR
jgi:hypothetical protein